MSDLAAALAAGAEMAQHVRRARVHHPKGWEPGFEWNGKVGTLISEPTAERTSPAFEALLVELGFDPQLHEVDGPIQVRRWQQTPGDEYLYYHRATIRLRDSVNDVDIDLLVARVAKRKARSSAATAGDAALVVCWADWQAGKSDGDGVPGLMGRLEDMVGKVEDRWRDLRKIGVPLSRIYVLGLGDLKESCQGHYAQQAFRTALNNRDQRKLIRWGIDSALDRWARIVPEIAVKAVGGNHGEEREAGKSNTDFADNVDVAVFEDVAYAYAKNPDRYEHVSFSLPNADLTLTFEHDGLIIGMAHGHQAGFGSGDPKAKIDRWWRGQMAGQQPIGDADILVTGHYHHGWW